MQNIKYVKYIISLLLSLIIIWLLLPQKLFNDPTSTILEDRNGNLLGAKISKDEQWRFPYNNEVPYKFASSIIEFEDNRFYNHIGIDQIALIRAFYLNISKQKIISGGSTISMQTIRLSRKNKARSVFEKIIEVFLAIKLELIHSKKEILALYSSNAPFGGNVVGLEAASWRYFNKASSKLTWSESATLAVLPNSPSLIFPGKNQEKLKLKRDKLLYKLFNKGYMSKDEYNLALLEPLPNKPHKLPNFAKHLLNRCINEGYKGKRIISTLDYHLQKEVNNIVIKHNNKLLNNNINNLAAIVIEVETGDVLAYIGNLNDDKSKIAGSEVDMIVAKRSTASTLKPFLYVAMLNEGLILPNTLVPDIPLHIGSFNPQNSTKDFDGAVPANKALSRSLNVPSVWMLQLYGINKFKFFLHQLGISTLSKPAFHYGLSMIIGGGEGNLWEITSVYASMARVLNHYANNNSKYFKNDFRPNNYIYKTEINNTLCSNDKYILNASSIWFTFEAMLNVSRPYDDLQWRHFASSPKIAWKTGTSFGNRDAWAIGCNPQYVVGVWVGNADGEGCPGMTGLSAAAPLFFDIFKILNPKSWFYKPYDDMIKMPICRHSGHPASDICEIIDSLWVPNSANMISNCPYHQIVHLDKNEKYRVNENCEAIADISNKPWFILPPAIEYYFKAKNPYYKILPNYRYDCDNNEDVKIKNLELLYPINNSRIFIPREIDGNMGKVVFKATHRDLKAKIYWQIDEKYIGATNNFHNKAINLESGLHTITIFDDNGEIITRKFEIINKKQTK